MTNGQEEFFYLCDVNQCNNVSDKLNRVDVRVSNNSYSGV